MAERPSFFRGKMPSATQMRRSRNKVQSKDYDLALRAPGTFSKTLVLGLAVGTVFAIGTFFALAWVHLGSAGTWEFWHGRHWTLLDLAKYLQTSGLDFDVQGGVDPVRDANAGMMQFQFSGFREAQEALKEEKDLHVRMHRQQNTEFSSNTVFVRLKDAAGSHSVPEGAFTGATWTWGRFIFTGDSRNIAEIKKTLVRA